MTVYFEISLYAGIRLLSAIGNFDDIHTTKLKYLSQSNDDKK